MFKENHSIKKLEVYLETTNRGFILLEVNDKRYRKYLIDIISSKCQTSIFDLGEYDFRESIECFKANREIETVVYYNLDRASAGLKNILEKINLSRDLLLKQEKIVVFIVPHYIASIMQEEFPNFYSYFMLKDIYIDKYVPQFECILPGQKYLLTKEIQYEYKNFFYGSEEDVEERLDFYLQRKVKDRDFALLKGDFKDYLQTLLEKETEGEEKYYFSLKLRMAKVCAVQEDYSYALALYNDILSTNIVITQYKGIYYEANLCKADILLEQRKYIEAIDAYLSIMQMIKCEQKVDAVYYEYVVRICSRVAICMERVGEYETADKYYEIAYPKAVERDDYTECFSIVYNRILLILKGMTNKRKDVANLLSTLNGWVQCDIQKALHDSLSAWYWGTIEGCCRDALEYASAALQLKRENMSENDIRIAESHYIIAILYLLLDEVEHAELCKNKCINILSNYKKEGEKIADIQKYFQNI